MSAKEQAEIHDVIEEFYDLTEELTNNVAGKMDYSDYLEVLTRLDLIDDLVKRIVDFSEFISKECSQDAKKQSITQEQQERIGGRIAELLLSLDNTKQQLSNHIEEKNGS